MNMQSFLVVKIIMYFSDFAGPISWSLPTFDLLLRITLGSFKAIRNRAVFACCSVYDAELQMILARAANSSTTLGFARAVPLD